MHILISKNELSNIISLSYKAINLKSQPVSLSGILFDATNDYLAITAANENLIIQTNIEYKLSELNITIINQGKVLIDADLILKIVNNIDADIIDMELIDSNLLKIIGNKSEYNINTMDFNDYPSLNLIENPTHEFKLNKNLFDSIIDDISYASSEEKNRPALTGVNFTMKNNKFAVMSTDSYRFASLSFQFEEQVNDFNIVVPTNNLKKFHHLNTINNTYTILLDNNGFQINVDNFKIYCSLINDDFPLGDNIIPRIFSNELIVDRKEFISTVSRANFITYEKKSTIQLVINNEEVIVKSNSREIGTFESSLNLISFSGDPIDISFDGKLLNEALSKLKDKNIYLGFSSLTTPLILKDENNDDCIHLVVPMKTYY